MEITLTPVQSSMLAAHGYDADSQTLAVQYKNGAVFHYDGVPPEVADGLANADSIGKFFNANIKGVFEPRKIDPVDNTDSTEEGGEG